MKAIITRGNSRGKEVEIGQWCNDWFTLNTGDWEIDRKPMSPSSLAFRMEDIKEIKKHNPGKMFTWFEMVPITGHGIYSFTFRKKRKI